MDPPPSPHSKSRRRAQKAQYNAGGTLQMPSLPRFHPANYSNTSSATTTPVSGANSNPLSPIGQTRTSDQNRHLSYYHQTLLQQYVARDNAAMAVGGKKPPSPKLVPLAGSPGAVTPLELEGENYLTAGGGSLEAIIREEARRGGDISPRRPMSTA
ncbi:hypothetical protein BT63DRAFT_413019 [Microthyrium microscopicum]|uniref:Uncharacterized protein n=1 Tax=Microthyrium microscopicum TaxID=703497 RepID=A0A6A6UGR0_9PEZI|nr:hypothetical protein BT63DRAFT_413019 [Microthyrium microscopicum]